MGEEGAAIWPERGSDAQRENPGLRSVSNNSKEKIRMNTTVNPSKHPYRHSIIGKMLPLAFLVLLLGLGGQPAAAESVEWEHDGSCIEAWANDQPCFGGSWGGGIDDTGGDLGDDYGSCDSRIDCDPTPAPEECPTLFKCRVITDPWSH